MAKELSAGKIKLIIILAAIIMFIPFLGNVHLFDWDEINFAECSREMVATNNYLQVTVDYNPFWEKPPLFIWSQAAMYKIFGVNEFAARLPNAITGIITLLILFNIGKKLFSQKFGLIWALVYAGSLLPSIYFKTGIIDPMFNLFMILSIYYIYKFYFLTQRKTKTIILSGLFAGLAILTKGPVGLLLTGITYLVFIIWKRKEIVIKIRDFFIFGFFAIIVSALWFGVDIIFNGFWFIGEFIRYQIRLLSTGDAGHGGPFYYHFIILLIGCFPASIFLFNRIYGKKDLSAEQRGLRDIMIICLCTVVIIFSIVQTKIVHYSSLAYYPITFLAALAIDKLIKKEIKMNKVNYGLFVFIGVLYSIIFISIPLLMVNKDSWLPLVKDRFVKGNLSMNVPWSGWESLIGFIFLAGFIASFIMFLKKRYTAAVIIIFAGIIFAVNSFFTVCLPKIEVYLQGAPVKFYESMQNKDVYIEVQGYKSYAHLYYSKRTYELSGGKLNVDGEKFRRYLLANKVDKPVYIVCPTQDQEEVASLEPKLRKMYEEGGFVFFKKAEEEK